MLKLFLKFIIYQNNSNSVNKEISFLTHQGENYFIWQYTKYPGVVTITVELKCVIFFLRDACSIYQNLKDNHLTQKFQLSSSLN